MMLRKGASNTKGIEGFQRSLMPLPKSPSPFSTLLIPCISPTMVSVPL
jgi:hypothetical protein